VAELDYAYLAEYAQITDGKLTAVNASFIHAKIAVPTLFPFAIAGRVRAPADAGDVHLAIRFVPPGPNIAITWQLGLNTKGHPVYDGKVGILFAVRATTTLAAHGLYQVFIDVDDKEARRLAFEAIAP
jgi:hypothetical protein